MCMHTIPKILGFLKIGIGSLTNFLPEKIRGSIDCRRSPPISSAGKYRSLSPSLRPVRPKPLRPQPPPFLPVLAREIIPNLSGSSRALHHLASVRVCHCGFVGFATGRTRKCGDGGNAKTQVMKKISRRIFDIPFSISLPREVSKIPPLVSFLPCQSSSEYRSGICRTSIESFQVQDCRANGYRAPGENEAPQLGQSRFWIYRLRRR